MSIPVAAGELEHFTPASLRNLPVPPVFLLRAASDRDWRRYQKLLRAEGLVYHDQAEFRRIALDALKSLWSEDVYAAEAARLESHWALMDQNGTSSEEEVAAVNELVERLARADKRLARLAADNGEYIEESMRIAAAMFIAGWTGIDVAYSREEGMVPLATLDVVEQRLFDAEKKALTDKVEGIVRPGVAWMELCNACSARMRLTEDEEKNSSSPPPSAQGLNGSRTRRSRKGSSSKASASSKPAIAA